MGYAAAEGILLHLKNVDVSLKAVLEVPAELLRLEVHGPADELDKLKPALSPLGCQFFATEWGFRSKVPRALSSEEHPVNAEGHKQKVTKQEGPWELVREDVSKEHRLVDEAAERPAEDSKDEETIASKYVCFCA